MNEFDLKALKYEIGNMKGGWERNFKDDMIFLSGAEMDFPTAPVIRNRLVEVAQNGLYGFTLPDDRYLNAIINWMKDVRNIDIIKEDIVPTLGTIFGLNTAIRAFTKEDDEIIIQSPSYYRFDVAIINNHRKVIYNPMKCNDGIYEIDFEDLETKMALPKAKMMVLCHPHNPTGKVFTKEDLERIYQLSLKYHVLIYVDEIFGEMQYYSNLSYLQITKENTIVSTSLGKTFNFTGINHANLIIPDQIIKQQYLTQRKIDHFGSLDPFFYNALIAAYSKEGKEWINQVKDYIYSLYKYMTTALKDTKIMISPLEGGFILWMDFSKYSYTVKELEEIINHKVKLIGDPGEEYGKGYEQCIRINLGTARKNIETLVSHLKEYF